MEVKPQTPIVILSGMLGLLMLLSGCSPIYHGAMPCSGHATFEVYESKMQKTDPAGQLVLEFKWLPENWSDDQFFDYVVVRPLYGPNKEAKEDAFPMNHVVQIRDFGNDTKEERVGLEIDLSQPDRLGQVPTGVYFMMRSSIYGAVHSDTIDLTTWQNKGRRKLKVTLVEGNTCYEGPPKKYLFSRRRKHYYID